jgi:hypothetical protein
MGENDGLVTMKNKKPSIQELNEAFTAGVPLEVIQKLAGHKSLADTVAYNKRLINHGKKGTKKK